MKQVTYFFWWCSGADRDTLARFPAEHHKYVGIGATIFFTGLFAALSGGYALYSVFSGGGFAGVPAIGFGLLWGLAIFNMDRYIVSSINKNATAGKQLLQATPRILLAILIGIVISRPLELKIFDKEIRQQLAANYLKQQRANTDTLNNTFIRKYTLELEQLAALRMERDTLEAAISAGRTKLHQETFGDKTPETSGIAGYGPYAKRRQGDLNKQEEYLDTLRSRVQQHEAFIRSQKRAEGLLDERLLIGAKLDSAVQHAGFADRNAALAALKYHADGSPDTANQAAITFIMLLFIFFECLPVLVKLMSTRDAYDVTLGDRLAVDIHRSAKNRDADVAVIDEVYDAQVKAGIKRQTRVLLEDY